MRTSFIAGGGFSQTVAIPPDLLGKPYLLRISTTQTLPDQDITESGFVYVDWQGQANQESFTSPLVANNFDAIPSSDGFIKIDPAGGSATRFITINASLGSRVKLSNTLDSNGKSVILVEEPGAQ